MALKYDPSARSWFVSKGTPGTMWKDGPADKRVSYVITTTEDRFFYEGSQYVDNRVIYNRDSILTVMKKDTNGDAYFLSIKKTKMGR